MSTPKTVGNSTKQQHKLNPNSPIYGSMGTLETRLARTKAEIRQAQVLRYKVFYEELGAKPSLANRLSKRDKDHFDRFCDHLLVSDTVDGSRMTVATYRLLLADKAGQTGGFYTQNEFDLAPLLSAAKGQVFLELGRSCVLPTHRSKRTMELLWAGTWAYALENQVDVLFGCASFAGTNPDEFSNSLAWLSQNAVLAKEEDCPAVAPDKVDLNSFTLFDNNPRKTLASLPPLLKGYLRLGAKISSQAVVDHQFGTTDVLVVLKVADISQRYKKHFKADASRFAA